MADEAIQEMSICSGKTVISNFPEEQDKAPEGVQARCSDRDDEFKWCGWKTQEVRDPDVSPRFNKIYPDEDEWYVHNGMIEEYHQAHAKKRSEAKFERDL